MIGETLSHYRIISKIGAGGMGEVYLAEDTRLDRQVALKILPADVAANEDRMRRFVQEAKAAAALNHPHIAHMYEIGESEGTNFIAMEFVDGETLREKIYREKSELKILLKHLLQVAEGLAKAHASRIVHRDLKPDNIMITRDGHAKILDFGLAKLLETKSESTAEMGEAATAMMPVQHSTPGAVMGTVGYMSPEQAQAKPVDQRSDIFSFGCLLYEAATGRRPFAGDSTIDTLHKIIYEPAPAITDSYPSASAELQRVIRKCLAKEPEKRYQTIRDTANDLEELLEEMKGVSDIERSVAPSTSTTTSSASQGLSTTAAGKTDTQTPADTSSAEYFATQIKTHRRAVIVGLLALILGVAVLGYFLMPKGSVNDAANSGPFDSLAILPLANTTSDPNAEYLSEGITESLINTLSQLPSLRVLSRSAVFRYKGQNVDAKKVGNELSARTVLKGDVKQLGDQLVINVELIDARDNHQIWGDQYVRKFADVLSVQRNIVEEVSGKLRLKLTSAEQQRLAKRPTDNPEAYEAYLKGRYHWNKRTDEGFKLATNFFQEALAKDPNYALAYTGLADCYILRSDYGLLAPTEGYALAKGAVTLALKYDDSLAEAHTSLASIKAVTDWDWQGAENEYRRAIELNPNYPTAHHWYAIQLMLQGRLDQALQEIKRAQQLDPLSLGINKDFTVVLLYARDYDKALEQCRKTLEIEPHFGMMFTYIAQIYELRQKYPEATAELEKAHAAAPEDVEITYALGQAYALMGRKDEALKISNELNQPAKQNMSLPKEAAYLYALLGEKEQAVAILQKAKENHSLSVAEVKMDPRLAELRKDARVVELLQKIGLSQ